MKIFTDSSVENEYLLVKLNNYLEIEFSFDSTKWTRAVTQELKEEHGYNSVSGNRQLFFDTYKQIIEQRIKEEFKDE